MNSLLTTLHVMLPTVHAWAEKQESLILAKGRALMPDQLADAVRAGVANPQKIRVLLVQRLPEPENEEIMFIARRIGLFTSLSSSLSLGYGICLAHGWWKDRYSLVHECVHVRQCEELGLFSFLGDYLRECIDPGYPFGGLEQEARCIARDISEKDHPSSSLPA